MGTHPYAIDAFMRKLEKKLAVRAEANQAKNGILLQLIDQNGIREHMTVTIIFPAGSELMISKPIRELTIETK